MWCVVLLDLTFFIKLNSCPVWQLPPNTTLTEHGSWYQLTIFHCIQWSHSIRTHLIYSTYYECLTYLILLHKLFTFYLMQKRNYLKVFYISLRKILAEFCVNLAERLVHCTWSFLISPQLTNLSGVQYQATCVTAAHLSETRTWTKLTAWVWEEWGGCARSPSLLDHFLTCSLSNL
jgi:hypothetical protein